MSNAIEQIKAAEASKLQALAGLHLELGYGSAQDLAAAIISATANTAIPARKAQASSPVASGDGRKGKRISDSVRAQISAALKAGETASGLPEKFGVSYNIVHELKKQLGMVTARSKSKKR
jgi:hypothetical protein